MKRKLNNSSSSERTDYSDINRDALIRSSDKSTDKSVYGLE